MAALPAALLAAPVHADAPRSGASAATAFCSVNGEFVAGTVINGTAGPDTIRCSFVGATDTVNGLGGNDNISVVVNRGRVNADNGNDIVMVLDNNGGVVDGGAGIDVCSVNGGSRVNCELG
ncbi:hypothetical protein FGW37_32535 [Streptomyces rectiverticillatus]|uniref:hypothetical protein n=1 Tax=Streptomyces rectiverticillatus TaxID=173860 RepID=UPI0015C2CF2B|nr:hypothetical protein [Streptomyces rectiverticillatus]QLE75691.1 hypothetical protein FGW37_32535 [Streptomyces rectiverticillatus]